MAPKLFLFALISVGLFATCSAPGENPTTETAPANPLLSDADFQAIHDAKNQRKTASLVKYLQHPEPQYRAEAAMALGAVQDLEALPDLRELVEDTAPEVRLMAAYAIGQLGNPQGAPALVSLIESDTTTAVRTEALEALGKCGGTVARKFLGTYIPRFLFDESGQAWGLYRLALDNQAEPNHAGQMANLLESPYEESRLAAAFFFYRYRDDLPDGALDKLMRSVQKDGVDEVRAAAARALGVHGKTGVARTLGSVVFRDPYPGARVSAISALQRIAPRLVRDTIWQAVFDGNPNVAIAAAKYFAQALAERELDKTYQQAIAHPLESVRVMFYKALLDFDERPEWLQAVMKEFKGASTPQRRARWVDPLASAPSMRMFLDSLVVFGEPTVGTAALRALHGQFSDTAPACTDFVPLLNHVLKRKDPGQLAYLGTVLRDTTIDLKRCVAAPDRLRDVMDSLPLPEAMEAWIELNLAHAHCTGQRPLSLPVREFLPIDWERLGSLPANATVSIGTTKGSFELVLLTQDAPATVSYFLQLLDEGFFVNKTFHRVVPNFVVQTGCPRGDGYGAPDRVLRSEFSPLHYGPGVLGMASAGKDTESSQWFVTHRTTPHLDGRYTIFGAVVKGMDVIWQLEPGDQIASAELETNAPSTP